MFIGPAQGVLSETPFLPASLPFTPTLMLSECKANTQRPGITELPLECPGKRLVRLVCFVNQTSEGCLVFVVRKAVGLEMNLNVCLFSR